ncbi:LptF/LptG family permease [candidate division KSB1 bacterium]|nr:LptF/LptG family permease [candidate division KSB1 bacterium]
MFIIWRYIIRHHVGPFIFAFMLIVLFFLLNILFRDLGRFLSSGLSVWIIFRFFYLNLASIITLAVPMALLISTIMAFGRLTSDFEIDAMRACGISDIYIITPALILALGFSGFTFWFGNSVLPDANLGAKTLAYRIFQKRPTLSLESGVMNRDIENFALLVQDIRDKSDSSIVQGVTILDNSDSQKSVNIYAEHGVVRYDPSAGRLGMTLFNGEVHELDLKKLEGYKKYHFEKYKKMIALPQDRRGHGISRGRREKSLRMMQGDIQSNEKEMQQIMQKMRTAVKKLVAAYYDQVEKKSRLSYPEIASVRQNLKRTIFYLRRELEALKQMRIVHNIVLVEIYKKYSIPVSCIVFILAGAPLGFFLRKSGMAIAAGWSFVFFLLYWCLLIGGEELAHKMVIGPFWAMWLANLLVGAIGVILIVHLHHPVSYFYRK